MNFESFDLHFLLTHVFTVPPSAPQMMILSNVSPFSVHVTWDPPVNRSNIPEPLTYTVILTNIADGTVLQYTLPSTQITLSNLLPGVQYNVSVYAKNSVASGPPVTEVFRINNSGEFSAWLSSGLHVRVDFTYKY